MIIDCVSDLHGFLPKLEGGDLLIVAGDLTAGDKMEQHSDVLEWLHKQDYKKIVIIAGNHDNFLQKNPNFYSKSRIDYLCDSGIVYSHWEPLKKHGKPEVKRHDLKVWGSPWTKTFEGMNPHCKAFTCDTEEELKEKWALIPDDTNILITHGPPHRILDWNTNEKPCGSISLLEYSRKLPNLKLFCFGHIHESYSMIDTNQLLYALPNPACKSLPIIVNASHVNENYKPFNKPVRVIL